MSQPATHGNAHSVTPMGPAKILPNDQNLRSELTHAHQKIAELTQRLQRALLGSQADRETRRAALNLMEDAVQSRVSEHRENEERRRVEAELLESSRRKDEFLATLAHELRNPLAPLVNSLHLLRVDKDISPAVGQIREMMERQVNHLIRLVDDLLDVSRITNRKIDLKKAPVELNSILASAVEISRPQIDSRQHQLTLAFPAEPVVMHADATRLGQAIANLLNNAAKYTPQGGQIWLTAQAAAGKVTVSVKDSGVGIDPSMHEHVFEMFTQVDHSLSREQGGLGIGLTLAKTLIELHEGSLMVRSEGAGRGSEFTVSIPVNAPADMSQPQHSVFSNNRAAPKCLRILLVDDNVAAADSLNRLLSTFGHSVHAVYDATSALEVVKNERIDIVISDIAMPNMDGYEFARRLRQESGLETTMLVALTGYGQKEDVKRATEAGFDCHVIKPISLEAIEKILDSASTDLGAVLS